MKDPVDENIFIPNYCDKKWNNYYHTLFSTEIIHITESSTRSVTRLLPAPESGWSHCFTIKFSYYDFFSVSPATHTYTHTHTNIYIYIYRYVRVQHSRTKYLSLFKATRVCHIFFFPWQSSTNFTECMTVVRGLILRTKNTRIY
jgi:hypothetical protein